MRAVGYRRSGDPDCLVDLVLPVPTPGEHDLLVRVHAVSVNPVDVKLRAGSDPGGQERVLGFDAAGVVEQVGAAVTLFQVGDPVWYAGSIGRPGSDSELHLVDERLAGPKPSTLDFAAAAALPLTALTAWESLFDRLRLGPDSRGTLLVLGAAGGVGLAAVELGKAFGARVVAAVSSEEKAQACRDAGADDVVIYGRAPFDKDQSKALADQFKAAGFPAADVHVVPYHTESATTGADDTAALIVRWRAPGAPKAKAILLMGHMDVVEAKPEDWTRDPLFKMVEKDGYYYGRGTIDMKDGIVGITQAMINLKAAGFKPKRDIVVLFTGDEETNGIGAKNGATQWLDLLGHPEFGLNADGGGIGFNTDGSPAGATMQTAEKTFAGYTLTVRNGGGHSSKPRKDNAIYSLAHALDKIEAYRFTPMLNETTRAYFAGREKLEKGPLGDAMRKWLANPTA